MTERSIVYHYPYLYLSIFYRARRYLLSFRLNTERPRDEKYPWFIPFSAVIRLSGIYCKKGKRYKENGRTSLTEKDFQHLKYFLQTVYFNLERSTILKKKTHGGTLCETV